ncbi:hypothetical protein [Marinobacter sp.]|uniref:hypothetical protein n=1 Tax=Marinobacter sp. TaxID=50741 RepID=UPI003A90C9E8
MMIRLFSPVCGRRPATATFFLSAVMSGLMLLVAGQAHAEERDDGATLSGNDKFYKGTVDFVHENSFNLIIDDYSFTLDNVLRFNNASWSREQVIQKIEPGDRVKMELGGVVDESSFTRAVRSITVTNQ